MQLKWPIQVYAVPGPQRKILKGKVILSNYYVLVVISDGIIDVLSQDTTIGLTLSSMHEEAFFAKLVNSFYSLIISAKKLHQGSKWAYGCDTTCLTFARVNGKIKRK